MEFALLASSLMMRITGKKSSGRRGTLVTMLRSSSLPPTVDHKWTQHCSLTQVIITVKVSGGKWLCHAKRTTFHIPLSLQLRWLCAPSQVPVSPGLYPYLK